jgi:hypothetical protein
MSRQEGLLNGTMIPRRAIIKRKTLRHSLLAVLGLFVLGTGLAQDDVEREGYFEVRSASTQIVDGVHALDARLQLVLSSEALQALESGVTLTIELQIEVIRVRGLFPDDLEAELAVRYELEYSPVSQRYIVRNLNINDQDSFATLYSALNSLGRIQGLPIIDDAVLDEDSEYRIRIRAMLNMEQYPLALRILFFWRGQWQLQSEWFEWSLEH